MSGIIDETGQQWEHCHFCNGWVKFPQNLGYTKDFKQHICLHCTFKGRGGAIETIIPAPTWIPIYDKN